MRNSKRLRAQEARLAEDELAKQEEKACSTMKLAMDTLDQGLKVVRSTNNTAKRVTASVDALELPVSLRLVFAKK